MKSCGRAVDLSVASFLVCDLISFVVGCAIHIKTIFFPAHKNVSVLFFGAKVH